VCGTGTEVTPAQELEQVGHGGVGSTKAEQQDQVLDATYVKLRRQLDTKQLCPPLLSKLAL
jgi:50S ribosomal subunit-associated GTPase HflX